MNERIRELAEQADWRFSDKITGDELQPILDKRLEKFAELIVKECTDFLKDTLDDHFAAEQLEEPFGVEE